MTLQYHTSLGSSKFGAFAGLLLKWRGSLYKVVYRELIIFLILFAVLSAVYRMALTDYQKKIFEQLIVFFKSYLDMIPLPFIMGFYVTTIATRWWSQFMSLPWPDRLAFCIMLYLPGSDVETRTMRWNLLRYTTLMMILVLQTISESVKKKYPQMQDLIAAGFMTSDEMITYNAVKTDMNLFWLPGTWFVQLLRQCRLQGRIEPEGTKLVMEQFLDFRSKCGVLWKYNWVQIPLVYTQVVTLATYSFFIACLFGRQPVELQGSDLLLFDKYFPIWTALQILVYVGLLKLAEQMKNPYGDDDADFELNYLIQRHMKVIRLTAGLLAELHPPLQKAPTN